jgi:hypothetical protein
MAESRASLLAMTILYVSSEIIPAGRPFLGLTEEPLVNDTKERDQKALTVLVEVLDDSREIFLGLLMQVRDGDTGGENGIVWVSSGEVGSCLSGKMLLRKTA